MSRLAAMFSIGLLALCNNSSAQSYRFIDLGSLGGGYTNSVAHDINSFGQIVGSSYRKDGSGYLATLWNGTTGTKLDPLIGYSISSAQAINGAGQIVGTSQSPGSSATLWDTITIDLGGTNSAGMSVNDSGTVVGNKTVTTPGSTTYHATLWSGTVMTLLGEFGGALYSSASDINATGQVVGFSNVASKGTRATLWESGVPIDLGTLGGTESVANAINNLGQIAGYATTDGDSAMHAAFWTRGNIVDLGALPGSSISEAFNLNGLGQAVGYSITPGGVHATVWTGGTISDLNSEVVAPGWTLLQANAINDRGWIVGNAENYSTKQVTAFLLIPVPEPTSLILSLSGLGAIVLIVRRQAGRSALSA